ncbi:MAG TPA: hypothetical protein VFP14_04585 [Novosphingobium sp.]|nr:hypothetical protein [Novosphingobium sp.]
MTQVNYRAAAQHRQYTMGLFRADFFRSLAAGFVLGALGLVAVMGSTGSFSDTVAPPAVAQAAEAPAGN